MSMLDGLFSVARAAVSRLSYAGGAYDKQQNIAPYYSTEGDDGDGVFEWRGLSTATSNGGTVVAVPGATVGRWHRLNARTINPCWFGADPTGVADSTSAIQAAITAAGNGGHVFFPKGSFKVTSTVTISQQFLHLYGAGMRSTMIVFAPTTDNDICFDVTAGASVIYIGSIRDISFYTSDTTRTKTALRIVDASGYVVENITVSGATDDGLGTTSFWGGGSGSIGVQVKGREFGLFRNLYLVADKPIVISDNPNHSIDIDHHNFHDLYLTANGQPTVTMDGGVNYSNVSFTGAQAWVKGTHGFYYNDTTSTGASVNLLFQNVRTEQGTSATSSSIYIASTAQDQQNITLHNCYLDSGRKGLYFRKVLHTVVDACTYSSATKVAIDSTSPGNGSTLSVRNSLIQGGSTATLTSWRQIWALPAQVSTAPIAPSAEYVYQGSTIADYVVMNGVKYMRFTGTLANGETVSLLCGANQSVTQAIIRVTAGGATLDGGLQASVYTRAATGIERLVAGTANFNVGNVPGSFTVFADSSTVLWNQLGESVTYVATVECS